MQHYAYPVSTNELKEGEVRIIANGTRYVLEVKSGEKLVDALKREKFSAVMRTQVPVSSSPVGF